MSACSGPGAQGAKTEEEPKEGAVAAPEPGAAELQSEGLKGVLRGYESVRKALSEDRLADAVKRSAVLAVVAKGVKVAGPGGDSLPKLAQAATALSGMTGRKPDEVRKAFGEVSSAAIELLSQRPELQEGVHMFECPMAQGYKRWIQPSSQIENPYMGQQMLECGSERKF